MSESTAFSETTAATETTVLQNNDGTATSSTAGRLASVILPVLTTLIAVTFGFNVLVMVLTRVDKRLKSKTYIYIFSLAMADCLVGAGVMTGMLFYTVYGYWPLGRRLCTVWVSMDFASCTVSMLHLCFISYDRYMALIKPLKYMERTKRSVVKQNVAAWALGVVAWVPAVYVFRILDTSTADTDCFFVPPSMYVLLQSIFVYYGPTAVMVYFYVRCVHTLYVRSTKVQGTNFSRATFTAWQSTVSNMPTEPTLENARVDSTPEVQPITMNTLQPSGSHLVNNVEGSTLETTTGEVSAAAASTAKGGHSRRQQHIRAVKMLGLVMVVFLFCWLPFCLLWPILAFCEDCIPMSLYEYSYWAAYLNSTVNPLVYFISNDDFRKAFKTLMRKASSLCF